MLSEKEQRSREIYNKLFQALEEGKKKEEKSILDFLQRKFKISNRAKISQYLVTHVSIEEVFSEILDYLAPFSKILHEIYLFLEQYRSTVLGKADQFTFHFEELEGRVPFSLDSFPKTYVDALRTGIAELLSFNLDAKGILLVDSGGFDSGGYWSETNALKKYREPPDFI